MESTGNGRGNTVSWHNQEAVLVVERLGTDLGNGLSSSEARRRLAEKGPNALVERGAKSPWKMLWEQFTSIMVVILVVAAVVSLLLHEYTDAIVIGVIVVLNALLGFVQEFRAERAMQALKRLAVPIVRARRDGRVAELSSRELVPGDIVLLEAGSHVPADGRLVEAANLRCQESALTGESEPAAKNAAVLADEDPAPGDRRNMVFLGTAVVAGRGVMVVTETGMATELGRIADMLQGVKREASPLAKRMAQLARALAVGVAGIVVLVFALGLLRGEDPRLLLLTAIGMAVAAIPEGLAAVVTIALALGAQRMLGRRALIRKLHAVETLGSVTVICTDKTGTLTENRMTVAVLDVAGHRRDVSELLTRDRATLEGDALAPFDHPALALTLAGGALCNDAVLQPRAGGRPAAVGDPTEGALVVAAAAFGMAKPELEAALPRVAELPFDSERKRMTTVHEVRDRARLPGLGTADRVAFTKGAVDGLLGLASSVRIEDRVEPMDEAMRARVRAANDELAGAGMRVLGVALRLLAADEDPAQVEQDLCLVGLAAMIDPPRAEVPEAVELCRTAGIRPVMITGDHPLTARTIAGELGFDTGRVVSGRELTELDDAALGETVASASVFARVAPEQKLDIVRTLQARGEVTAMTGDGVNDAPALRKADIGVAMGITGTDVAKEASDMVLLDDNFATIVAAVREGRAIYDNIRKFIRYTLTSNAGEIWVMLLAPFLGMGLPLLPVQILWVNLVTDGLPGLALGVEPAERGVMKRPPLPLSRNVLGGGMAVDILWVGLLMGVVSLLHGFVAFRLGVPEAEWKTMVFTTLTLGQMGNALATRSSRDSLFSIGPLSNRPLVWAILLTFGLQMAITYVPFLQPVFHTAPLSPTELAVSLALSTVVFWAVELVKLVRRSRERSRSRA
ncbi:cation-translocating P-type ATPase [candidate division WOR-3 bacterium]|nr:cation-translocating P-type ATPase [candidate division WOR-3 bacterium]